MISGMGRGRTIRGGRGRRLCLCLSFERGLEGLIWKDTGGLGSRRSVRNKMYC